MGGEGRRHPPLIEHWKERGKLMGRNSLREKPKHSRKSSSTYETLLMVQHTKVQVHVESWSMCMYLSASEPKVKSRAPRC